ncbi:hypothetical protein [Halobaculum sp. MBLA0143]|uniref:hypothetical protein n=1 Tax=Halobaculum sp. MBLA0143 TaxID=3079933 RepID=UPI0035237801
MTSVEPLSPATVFREWIRRETDKSETPDRDPTGWDRDRAIRVLAETFDEPARPAATGEPVWHAVTLSGAELGALGTFPEPAWDRLSDDGTVAGAVDRFAAADGVESSFPGATETVRAMRPAATTELGAAVARAVDGDGEPTGSWPPRLLDGNHRACAVHWAARQGASTSLTVHLAHDRPLSALPLESDP